jgi:hypothetical protein
MAETALMLTPDVVEAAYRGLEDGVQRWRDLDIAEWLEFEQPRMIWLLIRRNLRVRATRDCCSVQLVRQGPGRPGKEYWLSFEQAMVLCTQSRTPRAEDVRYVMIQVFTKAANGQLATAPRMELRRQETEIRQLIGRSAGSWCSRYLAETRASV